MLPSETLIRQSRTKLLLLLFASLCLTATATWLLLGEARHRFSYPLLVVFFGGLGALLFGAATIAALLQLIRPRLALSLNAQGLVDHARNGFGLIPWSEVLGIGSADIVGNRMLVIRVRDPQAYINRGHRWRRASLNMNLKTLGSPVVVSATALDIGHEPLLALCRGYLEKYGASASSTQYSIKPEQTP